MLKDSDKADKLKQSLPPSMCSSYFLGRMVEEWQGLGRRRRERAGDRKWLRTRDGGLSER